MTAASHASVYSAFCHSARRWPDRGILNVLPSTAAAYTIAAGEISYKAMLEQVDHYAGRFEQAGYGAGMRVALLLENRPVYFTLWLALNKLAVSVVPINPDLRAAELEYLIGHSEPALVIATAERSAELQQAAETAGINLRVITPDTDFPSPRENAVVAEKLQGEAREAAVLYTSGTTGSPKGCVLPNTYFLLAGHWYATVGGIAALSNDGERMITPLPIFHMNAMAYSFMAMVTTGGCLTVLDRFHPRSWWSDVKASGASCLHYLGVMPSILMAADRSDSDKDHSVRFGFGAGVDPKLHAEFEQRFGFPLVEAWAMTETGAGAVVAASTHERLIGESCLGTPAGDIEFKLIGESGDAVDTGQAGELLVRRRHENPRYGFFSHYYKNPAATDEAWQGGWFHTGDIMRLDNHGNLFFVDRRKNVIRRSGENIAAVEVESVLMRHPKINAAGVAAVADEIRGDEVFACLVCDNPSPAVATEITQWCLTQMAYYKAPGYIAFVDQLPVTATHKIQRADLKALAATLLTDDATTNTTQLKKRQST
ncbi:ATP-dependent acyl-CoA ligase [Chromatiales bacterium (ex Bugula neritina AB1)]|nr:ATP-dependent acyl-CoA ligase [Chromatiales bacterium (ex Bugula neritina AB1)]